MIKHIGFYQRREKQLTNKEVFIIDDKKREEIYMFLSQKRTNSEETDRFLSQKRQKNDIKDRFLRIHISNKPNKKSIKY